MIALCADVPIVSVNVAERCERLKMYLLFALNYTIQCELLYYQFFKNVTGL